MPKVLHVIARINRGGTARYLENLVPGLQELGWEVLIVTGSVQHGEIEDPIVAQLPVKKIKYLGRKIAPIQDLLARKQIKKTIREFQPDIIQTHTFKAGLLTRTIKLGIPLIHTYHGHLLFDPEFTGWKLKFITLSERILEKRAQHFITTGNHVIEELLKNRIGESEKFTSILPSNSDVKLMPKEVAFKELNLTTQLPVVVWLGRLIEVKNPVLLVEIARISPNFFFAVFGDGPLRGDLVSNAPNNISFFGWVNRNIAWSIADIALSTSLNEGLSMTIIEAIEIGIPIAASKTQGNVELLEHYPRASLHESDALEISSSLQTLLSKTTISISTKNFNDAFALQVASIYSRYFRSSLETVS